MRRSRTTTRDFSATLNASKQEREYWLGSSPLRCREFIRHMSRGAYYLSISRQTPESCNVKKLGGLIRLPFIACTHSSRAASKSIYKLSGKNTTLLSFWGWIAHIPSAVNSLLLSYSALSIRLNTLQLAGAGWRAAETWLMVALKKQTLKLMQLSAFLKKKDSGNAELTSPVN